MSVRVYVSLPPELVAEMRRLVPQGNRNAFIVQAVEREVRKRRLQTALHAIESDDARSEVPEWWNDPDTWLREIRRDRRDEWLVPDDSVFSQRNERLVRLTAALDPKPLEVEGREGPDRSVEPIPRLEEGPWET